MQWKGNGTETSGDLILLFRWCTYAGGNYFPDADGKDFGSCKTAFGCRTSLYSGSDRSDNRWCDRKFAMLGDIILAEPGALIGLPVRV